MASDNPIFDVVTNVLGMYGKPPTFQDRIDRLEQLTYGRTTRVRDYRDVLRGDYGRSGIGGSISASSPLERQNMFAKLSKAGVLPAEAESLFNKRGLTFYYDQGSNALRVRAGEIIHNLPTMSGDLINYNGLKRVNSLLTAHGNLSFAEGFYTELGSSVMNGDTLSSAIRSAKGTILGPDVRLRSGILAPAGVRGMSFPESGLYSSALSIVSPGNPKSSLYNQALGDLYDGLERWRYANRTFATAVKYGGYIHPDTVGMTGQRSLEGIFGYVRSAKQEYLSQIYAATAASGGPTGYIFTKAKFLTESNKILLPSKLLGQIYGTRFEGHVLEKGLYQVANMAATTSSQVERILGMGHNPYNPFITAAQKGDPFAATREMGFTIGVMDFENKAASRALLQEGGMILTNQGASKLATRLPSGTMLINRGAEGVIGATERLFGLSFGSSNSVSGHFGFNFGKGDLAAALAGGEGLTSIQKDLRLLINSSRPHSGLWTSLTEGHNQVARASLTANGVKLDFVTAGDSIAPSMETVFGGRRLTGFLTSESHRLHGAINSIQGIDAFVGADEFAKMVGNRVYLQNFVTEVGRLNNSKAMFKSIFGNLISHGQAHSAKKTYAIPIITDVDAAFDRARQVVTEWLSGTDQSKIELATRIQHGTEVLNTQFANHGITSIRKFTIGGAMRLDFMGDINMMKPIRMTPSKMAVLGSGARMMGYDHAYQDPLFKMLANQSYQWRNRLIKLHTGSSEIMLSNEHQARKLSNALLGSPNIEGATVFGYNSKGMTYNGAAAKFVTPDMSLYSAHTGGMPLRDLEGTIFGGKGIHYIDLGKEHYLNLFGESRAYRYLPVPVDYMRTTKGVGGNLVIGKTHPSYTLMKTLSEMSAFGGDVSKYQGGLSQGYQDIARAMAGKKGLLALTNTIRIPLGTRVRLTPSFSGYHNYENFSGGLFDATISRSQLDDFLLRKSGMAKREVSKLRHLLNKRKEDQFLYGMVSVDPMQRAEHASVFKIRVVDGPVSARIGQMNLSLHSTVLRMFERDTDRDAANLVFLEGLKRHGYGNDKYVAKMLEERIAKQEKLMSHFNWWYRWQELSGRDDLARDRLATIKMFGENILEKFGIYVGTSKSLGYTITRSATALMNPIVGQGAPAIEKLGLSGVLTSERLAQIRAPFMKDMVRFDVAKQLLQALHQGAVQKGSAKEPLIDLAESLVGIGKKYTGAAFDYDKIISESEEALFNFLNTSGKTRQFMGLDYMHEKGMINKETLQLVKADLERGATTVLTDATKSHLATVNRAAAQMMAEIIGPGFALAGSTYGGYKHVQSVMQVVGDFNDGDALKKVIAPLASAEAKSAQKVAGLGGETLLDEVAKKAAGTKAAGKFFAKGHVPYFLAGLGVGAIGAASLIGLMRGPEAPMPRDIDTRQPTDTGPVIYNTPPKIYGTNQSFYASKNRSPETFSPVGGYRMQVASDANMTIRDRRAPDDPYAVARQMQSIANSDYTY